MKRRAPDGESDVASADAEHASTVPGELPRLSHSRTRPSPPPVTTRPSGSTATAVTPPWWRPSSTGPVPRCCRSVRLLAAEVPWVRERGVHKLARALRTG
jgi:hypothetical protein